MSEVSDKMDAAAIESAKKLDDLSPEAVVEVAKWVKENYMASGYKRLCKSLMSRLP